MEQLSGAHVVRLYQRIKRSKNHQKASPPSGDTWPKPLSGCSPSKKFIASPRLAAASFRRRTGKRG
jgi:hypothetical protein